MWRLRFRAPDVFGGAVHGYLLDCGDHLALIDAGVPGPAALALLDGTLTALGASTADLRCVLLTHDHWDHGGLVLALRERHDLLVVAPATDPADRCRQTSASAWWQWYDRVGVPAVARGELVGAAARMGAARIGRPIHDPSTRQARGHLRGLGLQALETPGHAAEHVVYFAPARRMLFAGDHVLPATVPSVALLPGAGRNPALTYLESLATVAGLDAAITLPGHGEPFVDLAGRVRELREIRARREATVAALVARHEPGTVWELAHRYPWRTAPEAMGGMAWLGAVGEIYAHLVALHARGRVRPCAGTWRVATGY